MKQTLFLRNQGGVFQFRTDASKWKSLQEFPTGSAEIALGVREIGHPFVTLGAQLNERG